MSSESSDSDDDVPLISLGHKKPTVVPKAKTKPIIKKKQVIKTTKTKKNMPLKRKQPASSSSSSDSDSSDSSSGSSSSGSSGSDDSSSSDSDSSNDDDSKRETKSSKKKKKQKESSMKLYESSIFKTHEPHVFDAKNGANKWWQRPLLPKTKKWETLQHNGVLFPPPYEPHNVPLTYDGVDYVLNPVAEEACGFFAKMLAHGDEYTKNSVFCANFFSDMRELLTKEEKAIIKSLSKCDFTKMSVYLQTLSEETKANNKLPDVKANRKALKEKLDATYGWALIDGYLEKVGNYNVEIPGLFRGRGKHPKIGKIKRRIMPEDIILNTAKICSIPKSPIEGHDWKGVVHNDEVTWLAFWHDPINAKSIKYVYLHSSSRFKCQNDMLKYNKARDLKKYIKSIRQDYNKKMTSPDELDSQRAVATYLIDYLALRVGGEKDTSEVADTVGCCNLRVEHLTFLADNIIHFYFLGKDSMVYDNEQKLDSKAYESLKRFCKGKKPSDQVFHLLVPSILNKHLKTLMPGLSAKTFRTYNASITLQNQLHGLTESVLSAEDLMNDDDNTVNSVTKEDPDNIKLVYYNRANRTVAILCNHQRSIPKAFDSQMEKMKDKMVEVKDELKRAKKHLTLLKKGEKPSPDNKKIKNKGEAVEKKIKKLSNDPAVIKKLITRLTTRLENHETKIKLKDETKTVALGTSKINYMDPRITVAWCKKLFMPIEKVFNKSLIDKFPWAMETQSDWKF